MPNNLEYGKLKTWDKYALAIESWSGKLSSINSIISNSNKIIVYAKENLSYLCYIGGPLITVLSYIPDLDIHKEYIPAHLVTITGVVVATSPYLKEVAMAARVLLFSAKIGSKISSSIIKKTSTTNNEQPIIERQDITNSSSKSEPLKTLSYIGYACSYGEFLSRVASNTLDYLQPIINYHLVEDTTTISNSLAITNYAFNKLKHIGTISTTISAVNIAQNMFKTCKSITASALKYKTFFVTYILQDSAPKYDLHTKEPIILGSITSKTNKKSPYILKRNNNNKTS